MEDFKKMMLDEFMEMKSRKDKLKAFIETNPTFGELDGGQRHLLTKQLEYMSGYYGVLDARVRDLVGWDEIESYNEGRTEDEQCNIYHANQK